MEISPALQRILEALLMTFAAALIATHFARPKDKAQIRSFDASANLNNAQAVKLTSDQLFEALEKIEKYSERIDELERLDADKTAKILALETARKEDHAEIRILRIQQRENMAEIVRLREQVSDLRTGARILTTQIIEELHAQPKWSPDRLSDPAIEEAQERKS